MKYELELNNREITEYQSLEDIEKIPEGKLVKEMIKDPIQIVVNNLFKKISEHPEGHKYKAKLELKIEQVE